MRLVGALAIVLLTYNPTGYSFYHWALRDFAVWCWENRVPEELWLGATILHLVTEAVIVTT